jgi:hypothetical protein
MLGLFVRGPPPCLSEVLPVHAVVADAVLTAAMAGTNFTAPFAQSSSFLPVPSGPGRVALPMQNGSLRMQVRPLRKLARAASADGIAPALGDGLSSNVA